MNILGRHTSHPVSLGALIEANERGRIRAVPTALITVESDAEAVAVAPPDTLTWFTWGDAALPARFTVTAIGR